jgi:hypothetical protein
MRPPRPAKSFETRWLDETYRGREAELVSVPQIAKMARRDTSTVNVWARTHPHFPTPVKEVIAGPGPTRYYVIGDVAAWLLTYRSAVLDELMDDLDTEIDRLTSMRDQIRAARQAAITGE